MSPLSPEGAPGIYRPSSFCISPRQLYQTATASISLLCGIPAFAKSCIVYGLFLEDCCWRGRRSASIIGGASPCASSSSSRSISAAHSFSDSGSNGFCAVIGFVVFAATALSLGVLGRILQPLFNYHESARWSLAASSNLLIGRCSWALLVETK